MVGRMFQSGLYDVDHHQASRVSEGVTSSRSVLERVQHKDNHQMAKIVKYESESGYIIKSY